MSVTLSIAGPYYTTPGSAISLSSLRINFKGTNSGSVSASQLRRDTSTDSTDPIVPDATENSAISTGNNLKFSQFRGSVKSYTATQSGTDENTSTATWPGFRMGDYFDTDQGVLGPAGTGIQWNSNLNKNIKKTVNITGTCGSRTTTHPAAQLDPTSAIYNLTINVLAGARILGARGSGGIANSANGRNGGNGGIGLRVYNTGAKNLIVSVKSGALIAGGGGGGGAGTVGGTGGQGGDGTFTGTTYFECTWGGRSALNGPPTFPFSFCLADGGAYSCEGNKPANIFSISGCRGNYTLGNGCVCDDCLGTCFSTAPVATTGGTGGPGGSGANGGNGEGYDGTDLSGGLGVGAVTDWTGKTGGTNAGNGGPGGTGGNGGKGGEFGKNGDPGKQGNTGDPGADGNVTGGSPGTAGGLPVGNGGIAGKAIDGLNYILNPSPPPSGTIRGNI